MLTKLQLLTVAASPIDSNQANVIAVNHNAACSGPEGCKGVRSVRRARLLGVSTHQLLLSQANSTQAVDAASTSGTSRTLTVSSGAIVAAVVFANLL